MQYERCAKHLVPLIKVRMEEYEKHSENPDIVYEEPVYFRSDENVFSFPTDILHLE